MAWVRWLAVRPAGFVPPVGDVVLFAALCVAWTVEVLANHPRPAPVPATLVMGWALIGPVAWRQLAPVAALAAHGLLMGLSVALGTDVFKGPHNVEGVALAVLIYSVGAHRQGRALAAGSLVGLAIVFAHAMIVGQPFRFGAIVSQLAFVGVTMLTGRELRQRRRLTRELEERAALLRSEREARARSVADEERRRIARELHDVVTHVLGAMVVQASSLRHGPRSDAGELERTLGEIERSGREALADLRRLLGVLRGREPQPLTPAPTVRQVHRLVARTRAEGLPVELRIEGRADSLPPRIDVSAYRVVEEGLAGLRERGARQARVTMRYGDGETEVEVRGEPTRAPSPAVPRSWLTGIGERVAICGGELRSGDGAARELFIRARLPHDGRATVASVHVDHSASPTLVATPPGSGACTRILADAAVGLALFGALALDAFTGGQRHGPAVLNVLAFAAIAASVAWIPRAPLRAAAVFAATAVLLTDYLTPLPKLDTAQVALVLVTYLTAATTAGRQAALAFAVLAGGVMAVTLIYGIGNLASRQVYALVTLALLAWVAGRATRSRALLNRALREKAQALELERDERARAAGAQVRRQVARELHDVVAHGLTVMIVQAGSARRLASSNPAEALGATELIETTGREALGEMRRLLDVMSDEDGAPRAAPPGMESIEALLDRSRAAGLAVELHTDGPARPLPTGVDLAAYRVVQEALTNTIKHAAASHAELLVRYRDDALELLVADDGHGPLRPLTGPGHGLVGMRERVGVYGGELHAGRDERGGFRVRARFPLEPTK